MKFIKSLSAVLISFAMVLSIAGCGEEEQKPKRASYDQLKIGVGAEDGVVAENDRFTLSWEGERACVLLTDRENNTVWSTIPYDYYKTGDTMGKANSSMGAPLLLEYVSSKNMAAVKVMNGHTGVIKNGRISSKKIENGIKVFYCFDKLEIVVPVNYTLTSKGINISIIPSEIIEYENYIYKISFAPFMCSAANSERKDHYLVVPSGSGALMYTNIPESGKAEEYSEMVYGNDPVRHESEKTLDLSNIRLPLFGAKDGNKALCGIIEDGAACAEIEAQTGDEKIGRSAVWATFALRGSNVSAIAFNGGQTTDVENISKDISKYKKLSVGYYPLYGEDADYSGMAKVYRDSFDSKKSVNEAPLTLNILGGLQVKELFLGLPYQNTVAATTMSDALDIVKSVEKASSLKTDVVLSGFGSSGLDVGEVAGGYDFDSVFGSKKDYNALREYCKKQGIPLYADYDIVNFSESSNGFSSTFNAAKSSNSFTAYQNHYSVALRNENESYKRYVLLNRASLPEAAAKLFETAKDKKLNGISLSTLTNIAYSDYDSADTGVRNKYEQDVTAIIKKAADNGLSVVGANANAFAAAVSDKVLDIPMTSSRFDILDMDIPLYQMVFKGVTDISTPINTAINPQKRFLDAIASGSGMTFVLSSRYDSRFATSKHSAFAVSLAQDNISLIGELSEKSKAYYDAIKGAKIVKHTVISDTLVSTSFDNGVKVWVNYSDKEVTLKDITVQPNSFIYKEGV